MSGTSFICMGMGTGLVLMDEEEPRCAGGIKFSEISRQCGSDACNPEQCEHAWCTKECERCNPMMGIIHHESGGLYTGGSRNDEALLYGGE